MGIKKKTQRTLAASFMSLCLCVLLTEVAGVELASKYEYACWFMLTFLCFNELMKE